MTAICKLTQITSLALRASFLLVQQLCTVGDLQADADLLPGAARQLSASTVALYCWLTYSSASARVLEQLLIYYCPRLG